MKITAKKLYDELCKKKKNLKLMKLLKMSEDNYKKWLKDENKRLSSIQYQKKEYLCEEWRMKPIKFRIWYFEQYLRQSGLCGYCKVPQEFIRDIYNRQNGWRSGKKKTQDNKKGTRGWSLEIDRPNNKGYDDNCVLACYPCNNAKSNVFEEIEFKKISESIKKVWVKKLCKMKKSDKKSKILQSIRNTTKLKVDKTIKSLLNA